MSSPFAFLKNVNDFFRINFFGKPYELNKLVFDNFTILENQKEAASITKAFRLHKGWQYLGQAITFFAIYFAYSVNKKFKFSRKKQIGSVVLCFIPGLALYIYSHFVYWHLIRDVVKVTREREKKYAHLEGDEIENFKIISNRSKDVHRNIQKKLGIITSIKEIFM